MRKHAWFLAIAAATICGSVYASLTGSLGGVAGDYPGPPCDGCDAAGPPIVALVHGHVGTFFSAQPFMGSVSLLLRAPFVALATWGRGDFIVQYRVGTLVCFVVTAALLVPAIYLMLRQGQRPLIALVVMAAIVVGPATFKALSWGHPEEPLGAAFAVAAVLAAIHRRGVAAGVLLGLAVGTKQWGLFAVLPVLMLARGQRRLVGSVALIVACVFVLPMLAADPARFIDQNFHTAVAQLGVTPTNVWWPFHHLGFDPTIPEEIYVIPTSLSDLSHPLVFALALGLPVIYWRRCSERHPYDALQLLALLFLLRCALDPLTISYHHAPFVLTVAIFEGLRRRGVPVLTLTSTAAILILSRWIAPLGRPDLMNVIYLVWLIPTVAYLAVGAFGSRITLRNARPLLEQPIRAQTAAA